MTAAPTTAGPVIDISRVSFAYDGEDVIHDATLAIASGEFTTVVGPNGGGKTTLLRLILGLVRPYRGTVRVFGQRPEVARSRIGYVPQHSQTDPGFPATVQDVVLMGRLGKAPSLGGYSKEDVDASMRAIAEVGMSDLSRRAFARLSGGQRQRTLIARALASEPELLLLDEPTASLDVAMESELYGLLRTLRERLTVFVVSHDLAFVSGFTDTVACVNRTVAVHATSEVTPELINELYGREVVFVRHDHLTGGCP